MGHMSSGIAKRSHKIPTLKEKFEIIKLKDQEISSAEIGRKQGLHCTTIITIVMNTLELSVALYLCTVCMQNIRQSFVQEIKKC